MPERIEDLFRKYSREQIRSALEARNATHATDNTRVGRNGDAGYLPAKERSLPSREDVRLDDGPLGFVPIIGDILQGGQALKDLKEGMAEQDPEKKKKKYRNAAVGAVLLLAPNAAEKAVRYAGPAIKGALGKFGNLRFIRNLSGVPEGSLEKGITLAPQENIFGNFTTDVPFRLHPSYSSMPGGEVLLVNPEALSGKAPWNIDPMDTFFRASDLTGIDPKYITMLSGNEGMLRKAEALGMGTATNQGLIDAYTDVSEQIKRMKPGTDGTNWHGSYVDMLQGYRHALDDAMEVIGRPSVEDYRAFEAATGLKSGISGDVRWNVDNLNDAVSSLKPGAALSPEYPRTVDTWIRFPDGRGFGFYDFRKLAPYVEKDAVPYKNVFYNPYPTSEDDLMKLVGGHGHHAYDPSYEGPLQELFDEYVKSNPLAKGGPMSSYVPSENIRNKLKELEDYRGSWYNDGNGIPTVGYGFTGKKVRELYPNGMTRAQADAYFDELVMKLAARMASLTPNIDRLTQNQKDALFSYFYNIGEGNYTKGSPKMQQALRDMDLDTVAMNIDAGYNDRKNPGLKKRRDYERALFQKDIQAPVEQSVPVGERKYIYNPVTPQTHRPWTVIPYRPGFWSIDNPFIYAPEHEYFTDGGFLKDYRTGGKIHIKKKNRGKFTALKKRTGHSASWFKAHGTPAQKKMAVFELNSRKWSHKHGDGGLIEHYGVDRVLAAIQKLKG